MAPRTIERRVSFMMFPPSAIVCCRKDVNMHFSLRTA
jgi:hypothetical protein